MSTAMPHELPLKEALEYLPEHSLEWLREMKPLTTEQQKEFVQSLPFGTRAAYEVLGFVSTGDTGTLSVLPRLQAAIDAL